MLLVAYILYSLHADLWVSRNKGSNKEKRTSTGWPSNKKGVTLPPELKITLLDLINSHECSTNSKSYHISKAAQSNSDK